MVRAADLTCASCHFRVLGKPGYVCGYTGQNVRVTDQSAGRCDAWRRYFDSYMRLDQMREQETSVTGVEEA
jgi:hypothetical protein